MMNKETAWQRIREGVGKKCKNCYARFYPEVAFSGDWTYFPETGGGSCFRSGSVAQSLL